MKKISTLSFLFFVLLASQSSAQNTIMPEINAALLQKYIDLAKVNYPKAKVTAAQMDALKANIPAIQVSYLDVFNASYFYRPNEGQAINPTNPYTVNGWQFGLNFNLGMFLQKPFLVKRAKAEYKVAQYQHEDMDLFIAGEVKRRYYAFLQSIEQLKIRTQTAQDNKNISETSRHRFERGELSLDLYNASRMLVSSSASDQIQFEVNYLNSKDALEEIIGKKLTDVK